MSCIKYVIYVVAGRGTCCCCVVVAAVFVVLERFGRLSCVLGLDCRLINWLVYVKYSCYLGWCFGVKRCCSFVVAVPVTDVFVSCVAKLGERRTMMSRCCRLVL